jgi:hypothetical protein
VLQLYIFMMCNNMHLYTHIVICFRALLITCIVSAGHGLKDCEC